MIKLAYGLIIHRNELKQDSYSEPVQWFDTLVDAKKAHQGDGDYWPCADIVVIGLAQRLASIQYVPAGIARGYFYFGIHPDAQAIATANGVTDDMILGRRQSEAL